MRQPKLQELSVQGQIRRVFKEDSETALKIAKLESGFNCSAVNINKDGSKDYGLFQLNNRYHPVLLDCTQNILRAKKIRDQWGNFEAWVTFNRFIK